VKSPLLVSNYIWQRCRPATVDLRWSKSGLRFSSEIKEWYRSTLRLSKAHGCKLSSGPAGSVTSLQAIGKSI
jgi:hypothetical protein